MTSYRLEPVANARLDDIFEHTAEQWDEDQADAYISGLFDEFGRIARREVNGRRVPGTAMSGLHLRRWKRHVIYWRLDDSDDVLIVTILHERMDQSSRLAQDLGG